MDATIKAVTYFYPKFEIITINDGRREVYTLEEEQSTQLRVIRLIARSLVESGSAQAVEIMVDCGEGWEILNTYPAP